MKNNNNSIDSTPDLTRVKLPSGALQKKLFRSHLSVAVIGLSMLIVALFTTLLLRSEMLSLIDDHEPTVHASTRVVVGLERSLAALRGWVVLGDPAFKNDRASAWIDEIQPAIAALQKLSRHWFNEADKARLVELILVLKEDKEAQWWIEDVAQTPGNRPAQLMLMQHVQPITDTIISAMTAMIDLEKTLQGGDDRKQLQWLMTDFQASFTRIGVVISDFVNIGDSAQIENFQLLLNTAKQKMQGLGARLEKLSPEQRDLVTFIRTEFIAFELYTNEALELRKSEKWDVARHLLTTDATPKARIAHQIVNNFSVHQARRMQEEAAFITTVSNVALSILVGLIGVMTLTAWFVSKRGAERITKPIAALLMATRRLAAGHLKEDIPILSNDELGSLTRSFNAMRASLQQSRNDLNRQNIELEQEITDRKQAEEALHRTYDELEIRVQERTAELAESNAALQAKIAEHNQAEEMFKLVVEGSPNAIVLVSQIGEIILINAQTENFFGYEREELIGQPLEMLVPERFRSKLLKYRTTFLNDPQSRSMGIGRELFALRKDSSEFPVEIGLTPIKKGDETLVLNVIVDITERKQAEEQVLTLSSAIEQSPNAVLITDAKGKIEYINTKFTQLTGYKLSKIIGKNPRILKSGKTSAEMYKNLWKIIRSGGEWQGEIQDKKINGELYWAFESISPIRNSQGVITHYLSTQKDISSQKRAEEALQASLERFQHVADMAGEWIWEQDISGHYTYSSAAVKDILGYEADEIIGISYIDLFTEEDQKHWNDKNPIANDVLEHSYRLINHYRHKDGHEVFTDSTGMPLIDAKRNVIKWRGVDRDITARKRFEDALNLRDRAIEAASVGIVISDAQKSNNPVIYANSALSRMTGYRQDEFIGQDMRMLQGPDTDPETIDKIRRAIQEKRSCEVIIRNYRKDGAPFWNELSISPVRDDRGKLTHYIGVQTDITDLRQAEEERHSLEIAKQIQLSLLPKGSLQMKNVVITGTCLPAQHIGGDYFDYFHSGDTIDVVIADVSGHSVGAALIMAETRSTLKAETVKSPASRNKKVNGAADILFSLNNLLYEDLNRSDMFITMFYVKYHPVTGQLNYSNAGHNRALLLRHNENTCTQLDTEGLILGVKTNVAFEEKITHLDKEDMLLLYTDGITEAQNKQEEFFGTPRLCSLFSAQRQEPPQAIIDNILKEVETFCQSSKQNDDISVIVLKAI